MLCSKTTTGLPLAHALVDRVPARRVRRELAGRGQADPLPSAPHPGASSEPSTERAPRSAFHFDWRSRHCALRYQEPLLGVLTKHPDSCNQAAKGVRLMIAARRSLHRNSTRLRNSGVLFQDSAGRGTGPHFRPRRVQRGSRGAARRARRSPAVRAPSGSNRGVHACLAGR